MRTRNLHALWLLLMLLAAISCIGGAVLLDSRLPDRSECVL